MCVSSVCSNFVATFFLVFVDANLIKFNLQMFRSDSGETKQTQLCVRFLLLKTQTKTDTK